MTAVQIDFINVVIDYLTLRGWVDPRLLYESPFTDFSPSGVEGLFEPRDIGHLLAALDDVRLTQLPSQHSTLMG